jgi:flagellin-like hook-associated protein FlgL
MAIGEIGLSSSMRSNLISLQTTARLLGQTEERLSTGKRVNTAVDNPANFFAAQSHTSRGNLLTGLKDNISEAIQTIKAADSGVKGILSTVESLRGIVAQARSALNDSVNGATNLSGLATQYNEVIQQMNNLRNDASYKGVNFLSATTTTLTVNFNENATTKLNMSGFDASSSGLTISGGTAPGQTTASNIGFTSATSFNAASALDNFESSFNAAIATLQTKASELAANLSTLTTRQTFINEMVNTLVTGATKLTEADTNEEGANLLSLQTKQSLGTTALSISSQSEQSILRLF